MVVYLKRRTLLLCTVKKRDRLRHKNGNKYEINMIDGRIIMGRTKYENRS